jgi:rhodanese-related sulfurtransferase|tara:strand:- start:176 stop:559 length:384 start_codon:yes stop_codon:yes gene_type:complete
MKTFPELLQQANAEIKSITALELHEEKNNKDLVIIDVRSKEIIQSEGVIEGSINVPRGMLEFHADQRDDNPFRVPEINTEKKIVLYCGVGGQSALSTKTLQDMGFDNVYNLTGGANGWVEAGFNLKK